MVTNKRLASRIFTRMRVLFGLQAPESEGFALNLSAEGVFISALRLYPPGTDLRIRLLPTGAAAIELRGTVQWGLRVPQQLMSVVRPGMGIQLVSPPAAYIDFFTGFLKADTNRSHPRLAARLEVRFYRRETFVKEYTENISRGGLFIATETPFEEGTELAIDLVIPDLAAVWTVTGRVAYHLDAERAKPLATPAGIGVKITKIDARTEEAFRDYVQRIMRLYE